MKKPRSSQDQKKGRPMGVALRSDRIKIFSLAERNKRVSVANGNVAEQKKEQLRARHRHLLSEIINYEKQDFAGWPDGAELLKATQKEAYKIDDELDDSLKKKK